MTDERLRLLERGASAGDPGARLRLLAERARAGQLGPGDLRLAAYCGHRDAQLVVGAPVKTKKTKEWLRGLAAFGKTPCVLAAVVAARLALPAWRRLRLARSIEALEAAEAWLKSPTEPLRVRAGQAARACSREFRGRAAFNAAMAASRLDRTDRDRERAARNAARDASSAAWNVRAIYTLPMSDPVLAAVVFGAAEAGFDHMLGLKDVRLVVEANLRAWALGETPPESSTILPRGRPLRREVREGEP